MVQFFRGSPDPRDAAYGELAKSLGLGLGNAITTYRANKALDDVLNDEENANLPASAKIGKLEAALRPYGKMGQQLFQNRLYVEQRAQAEKEQEVLARVMSGENVSPKEFSALSPNTQINLTKYQQMQDAANKKINLDTLSSNSFSKGYKAILENDLESLKEVISDPNTPLNVKTALGSMQSGYSQRADIKTRDANRRINDVQGAYARAIAAERNRLGKFGGLRPSEVTEIKQKIADLEKARQKDMKKLSKNPESYGNLSIWGNSDMIDFLPGEENRENVFEEGEESEAEEGEAAKFDSSNPEHRAEAEKLYKKYGNKEIVRKVLREKYTGI
jgi:hypothetical protein